MESVKNKGTYFDKVVESIKGLGRGWTRFEVVYASLLIIAQLVVFVVYPENPWSMVAGIAGTLSVIYAAKGNMGTYTFGIVQTGLTMFIGAGYRLWAEMIENIFYFVSQFVGIYTWNKNLKVDEESNVKTVQTLKFKLWWWIPLILVLGVATYFGAQISMQFNGTQPYLDVLTLVIAIVAQLLMTFRFREQWILWMGLNVISIYQYITLQDWSLSIMYLGFIVNTVYGWKKWTEEAKEI